jgi:hypothetical protein
LIRFASPSILAGSQHLVPPSGPRELRRRFFWLFLTWALAGGACGDSDAARDASARDATSEPRPDGHGAAGRDGSAGTAGAWSSAGGAAAAGSHAGDTGSDGGAAGSDGGAAGSDGGNAAAPGDDDGAAGRAPDASGNDGGAAGNQADAAVDGADAGDGADAARGDGGETGDAADAADDGADAARGDADEAGRGGAPFELASVRAYWRCATAGCTSPDWTGEVIDWPAWSAHQGNARAGELGRTVYSQQGDPLYPYMGAWADGCEVTSLRGTALIIEWQRGTDVWRSTTLPPGQKHVIRLTPPEDGALLESADDMPFGVSLASCEPRTID